LRVLKRSKAFNDSRAQEPETAGLSKGLAVSGGGETPSTGHCAAQPSPRKEELRKPEASLPPA